MSDSNDDKITWTVPADANINISTGGTSGVISVGGGGGGGYSGGGGSYTISGGPYSISSGSTYYFPPIQPKVTPSQEILNDPALMDKLVERMATLEQPGKYLIVCVDNDVSPEQCREISHALGIRGVTAILVCGARAGYGFGGKFLIKDEEKRVDILARLGELWAQHPDVELTELLSWYRGQRISDENFIAATEVHYKKVTEI